MREALKKPIKILEEKLYPVKVVINTAIGVILAINFFVKLEEGTPIEDLSVLIAIAFTFVIMLLLNGIRQPED